VRPWLVVDPETGKCVGVISRRDMLRFQGEIAGREVGEAMSVPPVCVRAQAHVAEAAGVMLNLKAWAYTRPLFRLDVSTLCGICWVVSWSFSDKNCSGSAEK